ncbi:MAG: phosphatase PAP2 family protein, partial [Bacteroidota bacterium]
STSSPEMAADLKEVRYYSENASRDRLRIVHFWADGGGTYTPPGHWNDIAANYIYKAGWSEIRSARAFALLNMALHNAAVGCWDTKYYYFNPRPSQLDPKIKTLTGLPNFPSYPSGHSTFSASAAQVLSYLFPSDTPKFNAWRDEASLSRLYGAIHYRTDTKAGVDHGTALAAKIIQYAAGDGAD